MNPDRHLADVASAALVIVLGTGLSCAGSFWGLPFGRWLGLVTFAYIGVLVGSSMLVNFFLTQHRAEQGWRRDWYFLCGFLCLLITAGVMFEGIAAVIAAAHG